MIKLSLNDKVQQFSGITKLTITFRACTIKFYLVDHFKEIYALVVSICIAC